VISALEHIQDLTQKVAFFKSETCTIVHSFSDFQLQWKPSENEWSIIECLDHVIHYNQQYFPQLEEKINLGFDKKKPMSSYRSTYHGNMLVGVVSPDSSYKLKSSPQTQPKLNSVAEICKNAEAMITRCIQIIQKAVGCDLNNIFVVSLENPLVKLPLGDSLKFIVEHQLRHLNQIRRIIAHPEFPR